jgi:uncharacterized membrane protein YebE (DUF533 family)
MFNANDLLGALLQGGGPRGRSMGRIEHAMGGGGLGGAGGPLGQILGQLGGGRPSTGGGGGGDILGSLAGMAGRGYGGSTMGGGRPIGRDLMMGGLGALAAAVLSGRGRGGGLGGIGGGLAGGNLRGAVGAGGLALLGMLAMRALRGGGQQPGAQGGFAGLGGEGASPADADMPPEQAVSEHTAGLVLRAMIDAAKADGQVDATERQRIVAKAQESGADREALAFLEQELNRPADPGALAAQAQDPVIAAQVYGASLLAIQVDTAAERDYLRALAQRLGLAPTVTAQLHAALGAPPP